MGMRKTQECTDLWNIAPGSVKFKKHMHQLTFDILEEHAVILLGLKNYTHRLQVNRLFMRFMKWRVDVYLIYEIILVLRQMPWGKLWSCAHHFKANFFFYTCLSLSN